MLSSKNKIIITGVILLFSSMIPCFLIANPSFIKSDSIRTDSVKTPIPDSTKTAVADTMLPSNFPLLTHGSNFLVNEINTYVTIRKEELLFIQYIGLCDIIRSRVPAYPIMMGSYSHFTGLSFFGASVQGVNLSYNNRSLNDISYGSYNLEQFSPEFTEQIEILTGTDAVILHDNSTGAAINLQEIRYNTSAPYSRIFFTEAANNHITSDGVFSKNFARDFNFTFGFRSLGGNGRNENSSVDAWHLRGYLRWNPSDRMSISLTENYTYHHLGLNGGISNEPFSSAEDAIVYYPDLIEKNFRHDLGMSFSYIINNDSINSVFISTSLTNSEWDRSARESNFDQDTIVGFLNKYTTYKYGITGYYNFHLNFFNLKTGGSFDYIDSQKGLYIDEFDGQATSIFAHGRISVLDIVNLSFGGRLKQMKGKAALSFGVKSEINFSNEFAFNIDLSKSERLPSLTEGFNLKEETHLLALTELHLRLKKLDLRLGAFYRNIENPIYSNPLSDSTEFIYSVQSFNGSAKNIMGGYLYSEIVPLQEIDYNTWKFNPINLKLNIQYYYSEANGTRDLTLPELYGSISFYSQFAVSKSIARVGLAFELISNFKGERFLPLNRLFIPVNTEQRTMQSGFSIFATTKLGDAYLRISMNNILSKMYYIPYYPVYNQNFRLQVAWAFFD
jgi:hypothetical protein